MGSRYSRIIWSLLPALAALALVTGLASLRTSTASAATLPSVTGHFSVATLDGVSSVLGTCALGDSWCAYCTGAPDAVACKAFTPAHVEGTGVAGATSNSGNNPIFGVTAGGGGSPFQIWTLPAGYETSAAVSAPFVAATPFVAGTMSASGALVWCNFADGGIPGWLPRGMVANPTGC